MYNVLLDNEQVGQFKSLEKAQEFIKDHIIVERGFDSDDIETMQDDYIIERI